MILETLVVVYLFTPFMQPDNTLSCSQKHALNNVQEVDESSPQSGASRILCKSELSIHTVNYTCIH